MKYIIIRDWERFQHYKKRNPPWIRLHQSLLTNYEFQMLSDAERYTLIGLWLLAARNHNRTPMDTRYIRDMLRMTSKRVCLEKLIELKFIEIKSVDELKDASNSLAACKQNLPSETDSSETDSSDNSDPPMPPKKKREKKPAGHKPPCDPWDFSDKIPEWKENWKYINVELELFNLRQWWEANPAKVRGRRGGPRATVIRCLARKNQEMMDRGDVSPEMGGVIVTRENLEACREFEQQERWKDYQGRTGHTSCAELARRRKLAKEAGTSGENQKSGGEVLPGQPPT